MEGENPQFDPNTVEVKKSSDSQLHRICDAGDVLNETEASRNEFLKALEAGGTDLSDENDPMTALVNEVEVNGGKPMTKKDIEDFNAALFDYWT